SNVSRWKKGGHQDWLKDQFWQAVMRARLDSFTGILNGEDPIQLPEGGLQLAALGICELLRDLASPEEDRDPDKYVRVANSLARLSRSILQIQQYRDACAKAKAAELKKLDFNREFNEAEREAWLDRADDLFGFKSAARLRREAAEKAAAEAASPDAARTSSPAGAEASSPWTSVVPSVPFIVPAAPQSPETKAQPPSPEAASPTDQSSPKPSASQSAEAPAGSPASYDPDDYPSCSMCSHRPISFGIQPLPLECQLCPMCPVRPKPEMSTSS
ncbi:MAG TPA: hypothetical protein VEC99_07980, partial [Clostridia bacterium]|nr:hypothetical protein [Clostridia bacterium]